MVYQDENSKFESLTSWDSGISKMSRGDPRSWFICEFRKHLYNCCVNLLVVCEGLGRMCNPSYSFLYLLDHAALSYQMMRYILFCPNVKLFVGLKNHLDLWFSICALFKNNCSKNENTQKLLKHKIIDVESFVSFLTFMNQVSFS